MNQQHPQRAHILMKSILNNKKMLDTMHAAHGSKIGSSERTNAKNLFRVLEKTIGRKASPDATGGPGLQAPQVPQNKQQTKEKPKNAAYYIFYDAPLGVPVQHNLNTPGMDSTGGPGFQSVPPVQSIQPKQTPQAPQPAAPISTLGSPMSKFPNVNGLLAGVPSFGSSAPKATPQAPGAVAPKTSMSLRLGDFSQGAQPTPDLPQASPAPTPAAAMPKPTQPRSYTPIKQSSPQAPSSPSMSAMGQQAVNSSLGPTLFASKMLQDKAALKQLFPNTPEDKLPVGVSLGDQVEQLSQSLSEKYKLDSQLDAIGKKRSDGVNIQSDLIGYVEGRDKYVRNLNTMIDDYKTKLMTADTSFAGTRGKADRYLNFLYLEKGKHEKRYADFITESVDQYKGELSNMESTYNTALAGYQNELQRKTTMKVDEYNRMTAGLTEMYNAIEQAPAKRAQMQMMQMQMSAARSSAAQSVMSVNTDPDADKTLSKAENARYELFVKADVQDPNSPDKKISIVTNHPNTSLDKIVAYSNQTGANTGTLINQTLSLIPRGFENTPTEAEVKTIANNSVAFLEDLKNRAGVNVTPYAYAAANAEANAYARTGYKNLPVKTMEETINKIKSSNTMKGMYGFRSSTETLPSVTKVLGNPANTESYLWGKAVYNDLKNYQDESRDPRTGKVAPGTTEAWAKTATPQKILYSMSVSNMQSRGLIPKPGQSDQKTK
jgi:hypothetical protein